MLTAFIKRNLFVSCGIMRILLDSHLTCNSAGQ
jgi:hypothetical protein